MTHTAKECALHGVTEEIKYLVNKVGIGFHPDTEFSEYINSRGKKAFFKYQVHELNARLAECWDLCDKYDLDLYGITLDVIREKTPERFKI